MTTTTTVPTAVPGVVTIAPRAIEQVVRGVVRDLLGTPADRTSVQLTAGAGGLIVGIATPASLSGDRSTLSNLHRVRQRLAARVEELTGRHVGAVDLRITGAFERPSRRVS